MHDHPRRQGHVGSQELKDFQALGILVGNQPELPLVVDPDAFVLQHAGIARIAALNGAREAMDGRDVLLVAAPEIDAESNLLPAPETKVDDRAIIDMKDAFAAPHAQRASPVLFEALDFVTARLCARKGA